MRQTTSVKLSISRLSGNWGEGGFKKKSYSAAGMLGGDPFVPHGKKP